MSLDNINWVSQGLAREGHLTPQDMAALEERLPIAFQERDLSRQPGRRGQGLKAKQWTERSRLKSAHLKYRDVFYKRPQRIEDVARAQGIGQHPLFLEWMNILFEKPTLSEARQTFIAGDIQALHGIFHDKLCRRIMNSPRRIEEERTGGFTIKTNTTYCVQTVVPKDPFDDMVLWLDIALDKTFLQDLFPDYENQLSGKDSDAEIVLSPGSTLCVDSIFKPPGRERWQKSRLRTWEENGKLWDVTAGIQMQVRPNDLSSGTLRLCLSWEWHQEMETLYSCPAELSPSGVTAVS
ncbi:hypothetical protein MAJ_07948, partial [Metarhizium majus ARSEF 297]